MSAQIYDLQKYRHDREIKNNPDVIDLRAHFQRTDAIEPPVVKKDVKEGEFTPEELKRLLGIRDIAMSNGVIKDYKMPMSTGSKPIFSFKDHALEPDLISIEKAIIEGEETFIVRERKKIPVIETDFEEAIGTIQNLLKHLQQRNTLGIVVDNTEPTQP